MNLTGGYPYWLINNGLPFAYPKLEEFLQTHVVIIGVGISGALTAYYLTNAGIPCVLVDGRTIGLGSTCASTSLLQYELDEPLTNLSKKIGFPKASQAYVLCSEAIDTIETITQKIEFPFFEKQPSLYFAAWKKDKKMLEEEFLIRQKAGFEVSLLQEENIKKEYGFQSPAAILSQKGASIDAYLFTHRLLQESKKKGLKVFDRTFISKITYNKKGVRLFTEKGHQLEARYVVNASGYEIKEFIDKKIVSLHSTYAIATEQVTQPTPVWKNKVLLWNTADPYLYIRLTTDNRIMAGGRDEEFFSATKRDKLISKKAGLLENDLRKLFPELDFKTEFSWAGTFGSTKEALPYIGTYEKTPHTFYALGFGGNGITFTVIAAEIITDLITGKQNKNADLFSFNR